MHHVLHPGEVGVAGGWRSILPAQIIPQSVAAPVGDVERRISEYEIGLQVRVAVIVKCVTVLNLPVYAANGEVHLGKPPSGVVRLLPVDGNVGSRPAAVTISAAVRANELHRLHKHAGRAAAGVIDAPAVGLQHLDQQPHYAARRVELTAPAPFRQRELCLGSIRTPCPAHPGRVLRRHRFLYH